jgi:hypothetical protein
VLPGLQNAANDVDLVDAIGDYDRWRYLLDVINLEGLFPIEALRGGGFVHSTPAAFVTEIANAGRLRLHQDFIRAVPGRMTGYR